jgi:hypothetical protein
MAASLVFSLHSLALSMEPEWLDLVLVFLHIQQIVFRAPGNNFMINVLERVFLLLLLVGWGGTKSTRYCGHFWHIVQAPDDR